MSTPPPSSGPRSIRRFRPNSDTILPGDPRAPQIRVPWRALSPSRAYERALELHRRSEGARELGYRLYVLDAGLRDARDVTPGPDGHLIIGRHTRCDVVVWEAETVSLRHVLVRASVLDDGLPVLSLLDLDTTAGIELSDGSKERAVVATGPVVFRVGNHSFVALPSSGALPDALLAARICRADASAYRLLREPEGAHPSPRPAPGHSAQITIVPQSTRLSDHGSPWRAPVFASHARSYEIRIESAGRRAAVHLSEHDVERGILVGRAPKCFDAGLRQALNNGVSRVHALIIRERDGVVLYDIASTNGTFCDGRRVRRIGLADTGSVVELAGVVPLCLAWRALDN